MVERQEVEELLAAVDCDDPWWFTKTEMVVIAALCRRWLAAEDAPATTLEWSDFSRGLFIDDPRMSAFDWEQHLTGQRVRIVKEPVE